MAFKSTKQREKFYELKKQGKMSQATIDEWEKDTPKNIPERVKPKEVSSINDIRKKIKVGKIGKIKSF